MKKALVVAGTMVAGAAALMMATAIASRRVGETVARDIFEKLKL